MPALDLQNNQAVIPDSGEPRYVSSEAGVVTKFEMQGDADSVLVNVGRSLRAVVTIDNYTGGTVEIHKTTDHPYELDFTKNPAETVSHDGKPGINEDAVYVEVLKDGGAILDPAGGATFSVELDTKNVSFLKFVAKDGETPTGQITVNKLAEANFRTREMTDGEITEAYEGQAGVNRYTDEEKSKVSTAVQPETLAPVATAGTYDSLTGKPDLSALAKIEQYADEASFPATGDSQTVYIDQATGAAFRWNGSGYTEMSDETAIWGKISGDINNQADLIASLLTPASISGKTEKTALDGTEEILINDGGTLKKVRVTTLSSYSSFPDAILPAEMDSTLLETGGTTSVSGNDLLLSGFTAWSGKLFIPAPVPDNFTGRVIVKLTTVSSSMIGFGVRSQYPGGANIYNEIPHCFYMSGGDYVGQYGTDKGTLSSIVGDPGTQTIRLELEINNGIAQSYAIFNGDAHNSAGSQLVRASNLTFNYSDGSEFGFFFSGTASTSKIHSIEFEAL